MAQPELDRQVRQHGNDIDSLYELTAGIDSKVDALTERVDGLEAKVDVNTQALTDVRQTQREHGEVLNAILARLDGNAEQ